MSTNKKHARLAPSSSRIWGWCGGSVALTEEAFRRYPELENDSESARRGTAFHQLMEKVFTQRVSPEVFKGQVFNGILRVDDDVLRHANRVLAIVNAEMSALQDPMAYVLIETQVNPGSLFERQDCWGTADIAIVSPMTNSVSIIDLKYGVLQKMPDDPQLILYLLGVMAHVNLFRFPSEKIGTLKTGIYQPRTVHGDAKEPMRWQEFSLEDLAQWIAFFRDRAQRTDYERPEYNPDPVTCEFCKAFSICEAYAGSAFGEVLNDPQALQKSTDGFDLAERFNEMSPEGMDAQECAKLLNSKAMILKFYKEVELRAASLAKRGTKIPMYKLVYSSGKRALIKDHDVLIRTLRGWRLKKGDITKTVPQSISAIENALKKLKNPERLKEFQDKFITKPEKRLVLVPEADERPAVDTMTDMYGESPEDTPDVQVEENEKEEAVPEN